MSAFGGALLWTQVVHPTRSAISGREQCDPGQSILVAPIAGCYDEGDDRVAIAGACWDLWSDPRGV